MKKILSILTVLLATQVVFAGGPLSFRAGIMALPHNHWMLSTGFAAVEGTSSVTYTPQFTFNTNLGFVAGLNFTDLIGVEVNVIMGKYKQDFVFEHEDIISGQKHKDEYTVEISKTDIPVLFKVGGLMYFEVGPQFTMISKVEHVQGSDNVDASELYTTSQMFAILGTGVGFSIPKIARIEAGLRLGYGFQDINAHKDGFEIYNDKAVTQAFWGIKLAAIHKF